MIKEELVKETLDIEDLLQQIPYSVSISKLADKDKVDKRQVNDYMVELTYWNGSFYKSIKDFYGDNLKKLLIKALEYCKNK